MRIDIGAYEELVEPIKVGAVLRLAEKIVDSCDCKKESQVFMKSVLTALWQFVSDSAVRFEDLYAKFNEEVVSLEYEMRSSPFHEHVYAVFAFTFYYCLWIINGSNRLAGLNPHDSAEICEVDPSVVSTIASHAINTGLFNEAMIEKYFETIIAKLTSAKTVRPQDFDDFKIEFAINQ